MKAAPAKDPFAGLGAVGCIATGIGFSVREFSGKYRMGIQKAREQVSNLLKSGDIKYLGKRQARGGPAVYEVVRK